MLDGEKAIFSGEIKNISIENTANVTIKENVEKPKQWNAEHPELYNLILELIDSEGNVKEIIPQRVGFRE